MAPRYLSFIALLLAAISISYGSTFPARFVNALASNGNSITFKLATQDQTYSCAASFGAQCVLGEFGVLSDVQVTATDSTAELLFNVTVASLKQVTRPVPVISPQVRFFADHRLYICHL